nr:cadherin domain-containing protein [Gammaproteobacteria bacterium]
IDTAGDRIEQFDIAFNRDSEFFEIVYSVNNLNKAILKFKDTADFEQKDTYQVQVVARDKHGFGNNQEFTTSQIVTVTLNDLNDEAPVFTSNSTFTIDENTTAVTNLVTTDADANPSVTYSITGGADAASFAVTTDGVLTLTTAADYESGKTDYEVIVTANDGLNTTDQTITVTVEDINDNAPVFTSANTSTIDENDTTVTTLTTTDADTNPTVTYSITGGADASSFALTAAGVLTISGTDYESGKTSYEVTVTATDNDGANATPQTITVTIDDVNDNAPVFTSSAAVTIDENTTDIVTLVTTDEDANSTVSYSITGGADATSFAVDQATGVLTLKAKPDFENPADANTDNIYNVTVTVTDNDGDNETTQDISVTIKDTNDNRPVITSPDVFTVDENQLSVGTVTITDADGGSDDPDWKAFFIRGGADKDSFEIGFKTGVITFKEAPDYETKSSYSIIVHVSDGTLPETTQLITVNISNKNDNDPVFTSGAEAFFTADENQTAIGKLVATDADGDDLSFSLTGTNDVVIDSSTGVMTFATAPDYETKSSYSFFATVTDSERASVQEVNITINNKGDLISIADVTVDEEESAVFTVSLDAEAASNITLDYKAVAGTAQRGSDYSDSVDTGSLTIPAGSSSINFTIFTGVPDADDEETEYYDVVLSNIIGATFADATARVTITDNDSTVSVADASVNDGDRAETTVSIANASPLEVRVNWIASQESGDTAQRGSDFSDSTYSGTAVIPAGSTSVTIGLETFVPDNLDEEDETFTITLSNPVNAALGDKTATITIIDDDESPVFSSSATFTVNENQTAVGTVVATDGDGDTVTYSITGGSDASSFAINLTTGVLTFVTAPDYDDKASFSLTVTADDGNTNTTDQNITVNLNELDEVPPVFTTNGQYTADENQYTIGIATAVDPEGSAVTFTFGDGNSVIQVTEDGVLSFRTDHFEDGAPNYEGTGTYPFDGDYNTAVGCSGNGDDRYILIATDESGNSTEQRICVQINDIDEAPVFETDGQYTADENQFSIGTALANDPEGGEITYTIGDGNSVIQVTSASGILSFVTNHFEDGAPNY